MRFISPCDTLAFCLLLTPTTLPAAPATQPATAVTSPFDKDDPEIATIRALDWRGATFESLDPRTQCAALMVLNRGLFNIGSKADARLDLLTDYIDQQGLGEAYAAAAETLPEPPAVTFEDMKKVAAAYVKTAAGAARVGGEFTDSPNDMVQRYLAMYDKSARREFTETAESRLQVRSMGLFLQNQGAFDAFKTWADAESRRRQEAFQQQKAQRQSESEAAAQASRQRVQAAADARQKERDQQAAAQMAAALQAQQQQSAPMDGGTGVVQSSDDTYWGVPWYGYGGTYYSSNAYRGQVRDKVQGAYDRWRSNRPSQLPARGGGGRVGGMRGGGRGR